ncbi:ATP-binding protein [Deinococcus maricopensis]|uniref:AAA ATPase n=1 Tax=Deinococcus maricopensis (strain DSM 21211 / LMG 22137 / NRRL B-23946 / LB-34) TaxID=709986 RepID=E8U760_DEIML|nr:tetratricopeptide repeat protein [Deinococcus maricopensis]ADV66899.1 AAA ATPase [Deinococcus maricopensis DSM 21211]
MLAQACGYVTVRVPGHDVSARREGGAWAHATWNGEPQSAPPEALLERLRPGDRLAVILDTPERFDPHTRALLGPLLARADATITGSATPAAAPTPGPRTVILAPLSAQGARSLAEARAGRALATPVHTWLAARAAHLPGPLITWTDALLLEAHLRRLDPDDLPTEPDPAWEAAVAQHVTLAARALPHLPYLYGRAHELRAARDVLHRQPILTFTGPSGRGKTRLALQLAGEARPDFPGGVHVVSLAGVPSTDVALVRIAEALLGTPPPSADAASVARLLARRPTLLVLDAPEGHLLSAPLLEHLHHLSPSMRLIVTASTALGARGEALLPVPPLLPAAVRAALHDQTRDEPAPDEADLARLVDLIGGEPFTLELAVPLVVTLGARGAAQHLERVPPADRAPVTSLWRQLGTHEQRVLTALATFDGPFHPQWAERVAQASTFLLSALIHHRHLHAVGGGLYRYPGALHTFARAQLHHQPAWRARVQGRVLREVQATLRAAPTGTPAWFAALDAAYPTVRSALGGLLAHPPAAPTLSEALVDLTTYRVARGHLYDAREDLRRALRAEPPDAPRLQLALATVLQHLGDHEAAQATATALRDAAERAGNPALTAHALIVEGRVLHRRSRYPESRARFEQALGLARALRDVPLAVRALDGVARSALYFGALDAARQAAARTVRHAERLGAPLLLADALNTAALVATDERDLPRARELFTRALALHAAYDGVTGLTLNRTGLAWVMLLSGDHRGSAALSRLVLRQAQDTGSAWEVANALVNFGHATARAGQLDVARRAHLEAARLAQRCDAPSVLAEALGGVADVLARLGQRGAARTVFGVARVHPGANAEFRQFFAPLRVELRGVPPETPDADVQALCAEVRGARRGRAQASTT